MGGIGSATEAAAGNPQAASRLRVGGTANTSGIVSGLHRSIPSAGETPALVDPIHVRQLISKRRAVHAFLGVQSAEVTPQLAQQLGLNDLFAALRGRHPGQKVAVKVVRDGKTMTIDVTLGERASG